MSEKELKELRDIKALLIALLMKLGASTEEIGAALQVDSSRIRQFIPASKIRAMKGLP